MGGHDRPCSPKCAGRHVATFPGGKKPRFLEALKQKPKGEAPRRGRVAGTEPPPRPRALTERGRWAPEPSRPGGRPTFLGVPAGDERLETAAPPPTYPPPLPRARRPLPKGKPAGWVGNPPPSTRELHGGGKGRRFWRPNCR